MTIRPCPNCQSTDHVACFDGPVGEALRLKRAGPWTYDPPPNLRRVRWYRLGGALGYVARAYEDGRWNCYDNFRGGKVSSLDEAKAMCDEILTTAGWKLE